MISFTSAVVLPLALLLLAPCLSWAQLNQSVLIVYNSADVDSTDTANYYLTKRAIPVANLCPITPPSKTTLNWTDFGSTVKGPILNCLTAVGWTNILYIVFTYNTPYKLIGPDNGQYAIDQYIADIYDVYMVPGQFGIPRMPQPYYADSQSQGNVYLPFQSFADYRAQSGVPIFSVFRLDAASPALAKGLVDKALLAESGGLNGQVCIDRQYATVLSDYGSSGSFEWDLRQSALFASQAGMTVTVDTNTAEFGTAPAPLRCDNAALYAGRYSLNHYNDAFSWNPGAIGFHLESASAYDPRGGPNWSANALIQGITAVSGVLSEPNFQSLPRPDGIFRNLFEGANLGDALLRNTYWIKWVILNMGDPLYRPFPVPVAGVTAPHNSLALTPRFLTGGSPSTGTLTLATPAPSGGTTVTLKSSQASVTVPSSIVVSGTSSSFPIGTKVVTVDTPTAITATFGTTVLTNTLITQSLLATLAVSPASVIGGGSFTGYVTLNAPAPSGGVVVYLSSANSAVTPPTSVDIPEGATASPQFQLTTSPVTVQTVVAISATYAGAKMTVNVTVKPLTLALTLSPTAVIGGASTTANKITLNGAAPSDVVVSLSASDASAIPPTSVTIPAGQTVSPLFTIATSTVSSITVVAISASNNGVTTSANLTVNPVTPLSVTLSPATLIGGSSSTLNKVTLNAPAPPGDAIVTLSSNDAAAVVPASVTVTAGSTISATFTITTSVVAAQKVVPISASYNGAVKSANLTVNPLALVSITLSPTAVVGGVSATANRVTLNGPAPSGGTVVTLTSADASAAVPPSVTVAQGATLSPVFTITTSSVATQTLAAITASYNGVAKSANLTVNPVALVSVNLSPAVVVGGVSTTLNRLALNGPAPSGGAIVSLVSGDASAAVPASVTVPAGATLSPYFTITTSSVSAQTVAAISASYNGVTKSANLTVNPVAPASVTLSPTSVVAGATTTANRVTLNGPAPPGGAIVTLTSGDASVTVPPSVTVPAGSTLSPYFTITTTSVANQTVVAIAATFNSVTKSANLTVNP